MSLTRARALAWGVATLRQRRIDTPRLDAEVLLAHALGCERVALYRDGRDPLPEPELARFQELVRRRGAHEPLAYLVHSREFWSLPLTVRAGVLIPRPETEFVVEAALHYAEPWVRQAGLCRILDVGTGSGNIAIAIASDLSRAAIVATDLSAEALQIAQANARACGVAGQIAFLQCDLIGALRPGRTRFDLLLSNPPYIATREYASLPATIRCYEPRMAFDGGDDGLLFYRRLIAEAAQFLHNGSVAIVEVGDGQAGVVCRLFEQSAGWKGVDVIKDYGGVERVVVAQCTQGGAELHGSHRG